MEKPGHYVDSKQEECRLEIKRYRRLFITRTIKIFDDKMLLSMENKDDVVIFTVDTRPIFNVQHIRKSLYTFGVGCVSRGYG